MTIQELIDMLKEVPNPQLTAVEFEGLDGDIIGEIEGKLIHNGDCLFYRLSELRSKTENE